MVSIFLEIDFLVELLHSLGQSFVCLALNLLGVLAGLLCLLAVLLLGVLQSIIGLVLGLFSGLYGALLGGFGVGACSIQPFIGILGPVALVVLDVGLRLFAGILDPVASLTTEFACFLAGILEHLFGIRLCWQCLLHLLASLLRSVFCAPLQAWFALGVLGSDEQATQQS